MAGAPLILNPWAEMAQGQQIAQNRGFKPMGPPMPSLPGEPMNPYNIGPINIAPPPQAPVDVNPVEAPPQGNGNSVAVTGGGDTTAPPPSPTKKIATKSSVPTQAAISDDDYQTLVDRINSGDINSVQAQRDQLEKLKQHLGATQEMPMQTNLAPLAALADSWTPGSHMLGGYKVPETPQERMQAIAKLQEAIQAGQGQLSKMDMENLKTQLDNEEKMAAAEYRSASLKEAAATRRAIADASHGSKADEKATARLDKLSLMLAGGRGAPKDIQAQMTMNSLADRVLQLGEQAKTQPGGLTKSQIQELAIASANLIGGSGGAAHATIESLVPQSAIGNSTKLEQWLTNEPHGANQQKFVDLMLETSMREKNLAEEKLRSYRSSLLADHADLMGNPRYESMNKRYLPDAHYDKNGNYQMQPYVDPNLRGQGSSVGATTPSLDAINAEIQRRKGKK